MAGARAGTEVKRPAWNTSGSLGWLATRTTWPTSSRWSPTVRQWSWAQTRVASAPSMAATPSGVSRTVTSANLSGTAGSAKRRANASCPLARMLIAKCALSRNTARLGERFTRLHSTSGGSSDSEAKELMVSPTLRPSVARVVTMATPVG